MRWADEGAARVRVLRLLRVIVLTVLTSMAAVVIPGAVVGRSSTAGAWIDPAGTELLTNGSFESGGASMSPWNVRDDVAATLTATTANVHDGARAATVTPTATSPHPWLLQLRQGQLHLQRGTIYTLSVWAYASHNRVINLRLQSSIAPYPTYASRDEVVGPSWAHFELVYTPTADIPNAFAGFNLAQDTADVSLDNVSLIASHNMVDDGGFETAAPAPGVWTFRHDVDATYARDTVNAFHGAAAARIEPRTIDRYYWHVQLRQAIGRLWTRATYRIGFAIEASRQRSANVRLQSADPPYPTAIERNIVATTTWTRMSFDWTPATTITNPILTFNLGQDNATIWLDDVTVFQTAGPIGPCVAGVPADVPALIAMTIPATVHAGDLFEPNFHITNAATRPGATLYYQTPAGDVVTVVNNMYDSEHPWGITVPPDWTPGTYRLQSAKVYAIGVSMQYRNGDLVGIPNNLGIDPAEHPLCGRGPLNLGTFDLHVIAA